MTLSTRRTSLIVLVLILAIQVVTHLGWLSISAQSGQLAVPWLLEHGGVLFDTVVEDRAPGLAWLLTLVQMASPVDPALTLRAANLNLVMVSTLLVFYGGYRLLNPLAGLFAAIFWFAFEPVYGNILFYFNTVLGVMFLVALLVWWELEGRQRRWVAPLIVGLILGGSTLVKQQAWAVVAVFGVWILLTPGPRKSSRLLIYIAGALLLPLLLLLVMQLQGTLDSYLFWNWGNNATSERPISIWSGDLVRKLLFTYAFIPAFALLAGPWIPRNKAWLVLVLWLGAFATQFPSNGEIYVMAQLPLVAIMTGAVGTLIVREVRNSGTVIGRQLLLGLAVTILAGWIWIVAAAYVPGSLGRAAMPAFDEFRPLAARLNELAGPTDTLYVLPELDGSAQLHVLTGLPPPGRWIPGHYWFLNAPGVVDDLLREWAVEPPALLVYFPEMAERSAPYIDPLLEFMRLDYVRLDEIADIPFNGPAEIWQWSGG